MTDQEKQTIQAAINWIRNSPTPVGGTVNDCMKLLTALSQMIELPPTQPTQDDKDHA